MPEKIYFYFLILCEILSQGIIGTVGDEIEEPSDILVRQKRVVSYVSSEDVTTRIANAPYVVAIKRNRRLSCVGSILSVHVVITIPMCIFFTPSEYEIHSGASRLDNGSIRTVINVTKHFFRHPSRSTDGIALLTVNPPFNFGMNTSFIELHSGHLLSNTVGLISGWGYNCGDANHGTKITRHLRTIVVRVMAHQDCVNRYRPHNIDIFEEDVCTYHPQRHCGHSDGGAPLIVDEHLAGVHLWTGPGRVQNHREYPDVFAVLQHSYYHQWIRTTMNNIEAQFLNHHNN